MNTTEALISPEQLTAEYAAYKVAKSRSYAGPSKSNRCSVLGHPCTAYCYYERTVPAKDRRPISSDLASIFDEGKTQERVFQRDLLDMGWEVTNQQESLHWPEYNITGHRDFRISRAGSETIHCEFKSVHPVLFERLKSPEDIKNHKAYFIRKWYYQTVLYMLLGNKAKYWLILKNKSNGRVEPLVFEWNDTMWNDAEEMLKKAKYVDEKVKEGAIGTSDKIGREDVCNGCDFLTVCNPPIDFGAGAEVVDEETAIELATLANRREEVKTAHEEYEELDEEIKTRVKQIAGKEKRSVVFGDWAAMISRQDVKTEKEPRKGFVKTIVKLVRIARRFAD